MIRSGAHERWLSAGEVLCAQGIPIYPALSFDVATCPFATDLLCSQLAATLHDTDEVALVSVDGKAARVARHETVRTGRTARAGMAGNAMHAECVGIALLHILTRGALKQGQVFGGTFGRKLCKPGSRVEDHVLNGTLWSLSKWFTAGSPPRTRL